MKNIFYLLTFFYLTNSLILANENISNTNIWSQNYTLPGKTNCNLLEHEKICLNDGERSNVFNLPKHDFQNAMESGSKFALNYPVEITRLSLPEESMEKFFASDSDSSFRNFIFKIARAFTHFNSFKDLFNWLGLHPYPKSKSEEGPNLIASMGEIENYPMGTSFLKKHGSSAISFSCATCHSENLFGKKILGLTNRFPKANEAFILGKKILSSTPTALYKIFVNPSEGDLEIFKESKSAISFVGLKKPLALGLDTSLAQVGLSLHKRAKNEYADLVKQRRRAAHPLERNPADSKPAVWWNLKYKTRWLSDASIISGNPIHTNFLWNEIGRGADLRELETWMNINAQKIKDLTTYVFANQAPRFNNFFPNKIKIDFAIKGEKLFNKTCAKCHGLYKKGWSNPNADNLSYEEKLETTKVWYHEKTKTMNVGTDSFRRIGMKSFHTDLNRLKISKTIGTIVEPQNGYVPPPLVGIWARYPYFHNNSIPTLMDVLTPDYNRPQTYIAVPAENKITDYDHIKLGYPSPELIRSPYKSDEEYLFNTDKPGLSNKGHTTMLLDKNGVEKFSYQQKLYILEFLKTL